MLNATPKIDQAEGDVLGIFQQLLLLFRLGCINIDDETAQSPDQGEIADSPEETAGESGRRAGNGAGHLAGALDVPASWRKSLGVEQDLFSEVFEDGSTDDEE